MKRRTGFGPLAVVLAAALVSACTLPDTDIFTDGFWASSPIKQNDEAELGLAELAKGNYVTAEGHFQKALERNPQDVHALIGSGILYQNTGQEVKAREMYEAVLAIRPPDTEQFVIWNNIATKPIAEIASVNVALMQSVVVVEGMQRGAAGGQMDAAGNKVAGSMVTMKDAEARAGGTMAPGTEAGATMAAAPTGQAPEQAVVSGPMITRFADGDSHIVSRFITLRTLRDQELVTPEEYAVRRQANVGALLPLTAPPPAAGLDRPVPTTEQIVGRIRAINRALQLWAMTVTQHATERAMILEP